MRVHQRWRALPWGVFGIALAALFGGIGVYCSVAYPEDEPSVRVVIPMYGVAVYWVLALLCNRRIASVTANSVRVTIAPFFVRLPRRLKHSQLRHCYIRNIDTYDEGTLLEKYYSVGVETVKGEQIDISSPHSTAEEATLVAEQVARVLNQSPGRTPIPVRHVPQIPAQTELVSLLALLGLWLALLIGSVFVGFAWEEDRVREAHAEQTRTRELPLSSSTSSIAVSVD